MRITVRPIVTGNDEFAFTIRLVRTMDQFGTQTSNPHGNFTSAIRGILIYANGFTNFSLEINVRRNLTRGFFTFVIKNSFAVTIPWIGTNPAIINQTYAASD